VSTVSGKAIENVDKCKEVTVDSRFKFDDQTDIKIKKASPMLGISKRKFKLFDSTHFCNQALVRSYVGLEHAVYV